MSEPRPTSIASPRVQALLAGLPLRAKLAQLVGLWAAAKRAGEAMAPMQETLQADQVNFERFAEAGLGQFTRHYGTRPVAAAEGIAQLEERQAFLFAGAGIRATVHEECLTGVLAYGATAYPTPLAWGASFDPELVGRMSRRIGADLRGLGVHQGLAPVLDVVRDVRWGRVEECISEDPWLVASVGTAYVAGIEAEGVVSTLKHFVGYSSSRGGQNHGPVGIGRRELAETFLPPFELAIREGGARSVMNSYTEVDGVPVAADPDLLTGILRDDWGFEGTVVADYFAVTFLERMHGVAASLGEAAALALAAGIDVELPTGSAYLEPLAALVESGDVDEALVDRALLRVLAQKEQLGLLEPGGPLDRTVDLDSVANREIAAQLAEESLVLLVNDGTLPLAAPARIAVVGPNAFASASLLGCYSFVNHVLPHHPDHDSGIEVATIADALAAEFPSASFVTAKGCDVMSSDDSGIPSAVDAARSAAIAVVVVGDQSGMFGKGTSGEGCDTADLQLPGLQRRLVEEVLATGTPVVLVLVTGRPYILDGLADRAAAIVQAFLPGQEGAAAVAGLLSGRVMPSGRLPVGIPGAGTLQPSGYLHPILGGKTPVSSADPTPAFPFGFGLSYTTFEHGPLTGPATVPTGGSVELAFEVRNTGERDGVEVVQVYAHDPVASVTRPVRQLVAYGRVAVPAGGSVGVRAVVDCAAFSLVDRSLERVVEPGTIRLIVARDALDEGQSVDVQLTGPVVAARYPGAAGRVVAPA